ncbi:MAG: NAD(P)-dependent oxidoreductase [Planctomycetales bacterium]|nr:NAD(P)-dependent oxidoreductase [Planctomycetales bacterium]
MTRVTITGVAGNLGWKLARHLLGVDAVSHVTGLDLRTPNDVGLSEVNDSERWECVACDLTDYDDRRWRDVFDRSDAVVHFAARNPFPDASWSDANASLDMTLSTALAAVDSGVRRYVFVSSNHVMGRYKDEPLAGTIGPGELTTDLPHAVGTQWHTGERQLDSTPYAVAKSSGERLCQALGARRAGATTFVSIRVGWCQEGENHPSTLALSWKPGEAKPALPTDPDAIVADAWFKLMWLSNRDFCQLFERAVLVDGSEWPGGAIVVNGNSANTGMKWSLDEARRWLGYEPRDDVRRDVAIG